LSYEFEKPRECNCVPLVKRVDSRKKRSLEMIYRHRVIS
jgi:hypothetical protein